MASKSAEPSSAGGDVDRGGSRAASGRARKHARVSRVLSRGADAHDSGRLARARSRSAPALAHRRRSIRRVGSRRCRHGARGSALQPVRGTRCGLGLAAPLRSAGGARALQPAGVQPLRFDAGSLRGARRRRGRLDVRSLRRTYGRGSAHSGGTLKHARSFHALAQLGRRTGLHSTGGAVSAEADAAPAARSPASATGSPPAAPAAPAPPSSGPHANANTTSHRMPRLNGRGLAIARVNLNARRRMLVAHWASSRGGSGAARSASMGDPFSGGGGGGGAAGGAERASASKTPGSPRSA
jgi:hypothetical protein